MHNAVLERRLVYRLNPGSVGGFQKNAETWTRDQTVGGRIRTSEWRNQNLPEGFAFEHRPLHFEEDGATVFREACKLGCEGVVSKRLALPLWTFAPLGEGEKPQSASGETRGRGELGPLIISQAQFE